MKEKNVSISGSLVQKENPEQISTMFIEVETIEKYTDKVNELGAKVVKKKQEIAEGYYAVLKDTQGNTFGVWQNNSCLQILCVLYRIEIKIMLMK